MKLKSSSVLGEMSPHSVGHLTNLKSQFMETEAWHSFVSESLYDDDSTSGDSSSNKHQDNYQSHVSKTVILCQTRAVITINNVLFLRRPYIVHYCR